MTHSLITALLLVSAGHKMADSQTWAQPVLLKDGVIVRDADSVTRWGF